MAEARACEAAGVDFVCAQGFEAGGHCGTFLGDFENSAIGLVWAGQGAGMSRALPAAELVAQLVEETRSRLSAT